MYAVGQPIYLPQKENPTIKDINAGHKLFKKELIYLFDKYKKFYDPKWANKELRIV